MTVQENRAALITGAGKRLGAGLAMFLASEGYDIALHYHRSEHDALITRKKILDTGRQCYLYKGDLMDTGFITELISGAESNLPGLSLLINSASVFKRAPVRDTSPDMFDEIMAVNLKAPFFLIREYARIIGRGSIINILDTKTATDHNVYAAYVLSKKSLMDLTRIAAREFAPDIRVNGICPGLVLPGENDDEEYIARLVKKIPVGSVGKITDIARTVKYLADNEFVTGESIFVDGGERLR